MIKTILKFLIALIAPSTLTVIYLFSESHIVKAVSTDSDGELLKTLLRSGLGVSSVIIFALSYWICELKVQLKIKKNTIPDKLKLEEENANLKLKIEEHKKTIDTLSKTAYDVLKHNKPPQFIPKFGVFWDKNKEPYCPSCTVLLSNYQSFVHDLTGKTEYFFRCLKCKQVVHLKDGENPISLDDARKRI